MRGLVTLVLLVASVAGSLPQPARAGIGNLVQVRNNRFELNEINIAAGETVVWFVRDGGHTLTADDGRFEAPGNDATLRTGDLFTWRFDDEETFTYRCRIHAPRMRGVVVVTP